MLEIVLHLKQHSTENKLNYLKRLHFIISLSLLFSLLSFSQTSIIRGVILDESNQPIENVNVKASTGEPNS